MTQNEKENNSKTEEIIEEDNVEQKKQVPKKHKKMIISSFGLFEVIVFIMAFSIVSCLLGYVIGNQNKKEMNPEKVTQSKELQTFIDQYNYILENYYGDINKEELIQNAIAGMLSSLDEYSGLLDSSSNSFNVTLEGSYQGVGIEISNDERGNIVIRKVYEDTPAAKAGLQANDIITKFNDVDLTEKNSSELVNLIQGKEKMRLTIQRGEETFEVKVTREAITLKSVAYGMLENKIGYISISIFANNTYGQFKEALESLENSGMEKLIIDVRGNGGGYLSSVDRMIGLFVDSSHVIYQTEVKGNVEKFYSKGKTNKQYPIVILQNRGSASASEILTSSLKENCNAYIIGDRSYGKGTVQELQSVEGVGQYKFTTKKWLTPNGNWIHEKGIEPDLEVSIDTGYLENPTRENDTQFQAALKYLKELNS